MGNSLCCSNTNFNVCSPHDTNDKTFVYLTSPIQRDPAAILNLKRTRAKANGNPHSPYKNSDLKNIMKNDRAILARRGSQAKQQTWKMQMVFNVKAPFDVKNVSYSQRRYLGFRNRFEFDKKRLLLASEKQIVIVGYNQIEQPYELFRGPILEFQQDIQDESSPTEQVGKYDGFEIKLVKFMEDHISNFILVVAQDASNKKIEFKILKISKNKEGLSSAIEEYLNQEKSNKDFIADHVTEQINKGNYRRDQLRKNDNIEVVPAKSAASRSKNPKKRKASLISNNFYQIDNPLTSNNENSRNRILFSGTENKPNKVNKSQTHKTAIQSFQNDARKIGVGIQKSEFIKSQIIHQRANTTMPASVNKIVLQNQTMKSLDLNKSFMIETLNIKDQPFYLEQFGKLSMKGQVDMAQLHYGPDGNFLFTLDSQQLIINIFLIRTRLEDQKENIETLNPKVANFTMSKKSIIRLDFEPNNIDFYADYLLVTYNRPMKIIDIYEKKGTLCNRMDIEESLHVYNLELVNIQRAMFPKLRWSDRKIEEFERANKSQLLKKMVIVGQCRQQQINKEITLLKELEDQNNKLIESQNVTNQDENIQTFIAIFNIHTQQIEKIQLLKTKYGEVSCVNFGPFDNGYLLVGLTKGVLIAFDINDLSIIMQEKIFEDVEIADISFEPTNLVFVTSSNDDVVTLNFIKKEVHYMYVELGKKQYCTVKVPHSRINIYQKQTQQKTEQNNDDNEEEYEKNNDNILRICC
ncbi:UNKNOWN [Stylonychia lemnae]|uniref:Uncharacterized protein n=1 Tax=Stylonychia lemnae TaxID=5949 RepID=A0A078AU66_STYLE|nr:UNKNOWN [Stylonychia lemnae]|eukprot:CDW85950.1 UNKNOWN [Stylonychia lemnae]